MDFLPPPNPLLLIPAVDQDSLLGTFSRRKREQEFVPTQFPNSWREALVNPSTLDLFFQVRESKNGLTPLNFQLISCRFFQHIFLKALPSGIVSRPPFYRNSPSLAVPYSTCHRSGLNFSKSQPKIRLFGSFYRWVNQFVRANRFFWYPFNSLPILMFPYLTLISAHLSPIFFWIRHMLRIYLSLQISPSLLNT